MKWLALTLLVAIAAGPGTAAAAPAEKSPAAPSADVVVGKLVGSVVSITMAEDQKSAVAVLKDSKSGEEVEIFVDDQLTLEKFKDKRISAGDEIRCKYEVVEGRKHSTYFRKVGGC